MGGKTLFAPGISLEKTNHPWKKGVPRFGAFRGRGALPKASLILGPHCRRNGRGPKKARGPAVSLAICFVRSAGGVRPNAWNPRAGCRTRKKRPPNALVDRPVGVSKGAEQKAFRKSDGAFLWEFPSPAFRGGDELYRPGGGRWVGPPRPKDGTSQGGGGGRGFRKNKPGGKKKIIVRVWEFPVFCCCGGTRGFGPPNHSQLQRGANFLARRGPSAPLGPRGRFFRQKKKNTEFSRAAGGEEIRKRKIGFWSQGPSKIRVKFWGPVSSGPNPGRFIRRGTKKKKTRRGQGAFCFGFFFPPNIWRAGAAGWAA
jgi:hypothetical protein